MKIMRLVHSNDTKGFIKLCETMNHEEIRNIKVYPESTLLIASACYGCYDIAKYLIDVVKVDVNQQVKNGVTAINGAVQNRHYQSVELLLDSGASCELRTRQDISPLISCIMMDDPKMIDILLLRGACLNLKCRFKAIDNLIEGCSDEIKSVIKFHREWRRKKSQIVLFNHLENQLTSSADNHMLKPLMAKKDLLKCIIKDYF